jgi:hypothetical protein
VQSDSRKPLASHAVAAKLKLHPQLSAELEVKADVEDEGARSSLAQRCGECLCMQLERPVRQPLATDCRSEHEQIRTTANSVVRRFLLISFRSTRTNVTLAVGSQVVLRQ